MEQHLVVELEVMVLTLKRLINLDNCVGICTFTCEHIFAAFLFEKCVCAF